MIKSLILLSGLIYLFLAPVIMADPRQEGSVTNSNLAIIGVESSAEGETPRGRLNLVAPSIDVRGLKREELLERIKSAKGKFKAEEILIETPHYRPSYTEFEPRLGTYTYRVSWQGIPAATLTVTINEDQEEFRVQAAARTYSGIDLFYKLRYNVDSFLKIDDLSPVSTSIDHLENSRYRSFQLDFQKDGFIHTVRYRKGKYLEDFGFNPENYTLDPVSAAFVARSLDWKVGETKEFDTFNGKSRYLITLTADKEEKIFINGEFRDTWVISPQVINLTNAEQNKKLRWAKIYMSKDKFREPLKVISSVFVGSVKTQLTKFVPHKDQVRNLSLAKND